MWYLLVGLSLYAKSDIEVKCLFFSLSFPFYPTTKRKEKKKKGSSVNLKLMMVHVDCLSFSCTDVWGFALSLLHQCEFLSCFRILRKQEISDMDIFCYNAISNFSIISFTLTWQLIMTLVIFLTLPWVTLNAILIFPWDLSLSTNDLEPLKS